MLSRRLKKYVIEANCNFLYLPLPGSGRHAHALAVDPAGYTWPE